MLRPVSDIFPQMIIFVRNLVWTELLGCVRGYVRGGGEWGKSKGKMEHIEELHLSGVFELVPLERRYLYEIYENTTTSLSRACSLGIWERTIAWAKKTWCL